PAHGAAQLSPTAGMARHRERRFVVVSARARTSRSRHGQDTSCSWGAQLNPAPGLRAQSDSRHHFFGVSLGHSPSLGVGEGCSRSSLSSEYVSGRDSNVGDPVFFCDTTYFSGVRTEGSGDDPLIRSGHSTFGAMFVDGGELAAAPFI